MGSILYDIGVAFASACDFFTSLAWIVAILFVFSGLDDVLYDGWYWLRVIVRTRHRSVRKYPQLTVEKMEAKEQQKVAIITPAWHEHAVIYDMLSNLCETQRYRNYDVFVGVYANDPETLAEVQRAAKRYPQVHAVTGPSAGPTTKGDNLNAIYAAVRDFERRDNTHYEVIVLQDAEDVIHPFALLLYNYLIPRKDMIQTPVFPKEGSFWHATQWTYADEFAELHTKDLVVREATKTFVPSAGVGTALSRRAADMLLATRQPDLFDPANLTEDYEMGYRIHNQQLSSVYVPQRVRYEKGAELSEEQKHYAGDWIATRSLFPATFSTAVRQRSRWIYGIALQGWHNIGWRGNASVVYSLMRDRKVLAACVVNMVAYAVFAYFLVYELLARLPQTRGAMPIPPIILKGTFLWVLVFGSTVLMVNRLVQRCIATTRIYGFGEGLLSMPRAVWSNFINFFATMRALGLFFRGARHHAAVAWEKTDHAFPQVVGAPAPAPAPPESSLPTGDARVAAIIAEMRGPNETGRMEAMRAIRRPDAEHVLPPLLERLGDDSWRVRALAARTLGFLRHAGSAERLAKGCTDPDWTVRANSAKALLKLGAIGERALLQLLTSDDRFAREIALKTLEQSGAIERYVEMISRVGAQNAPEAVNFFSFLETHGPSRLAQAVLQQHGINDVKTPTEPEAQA